MTRSKLTSKTCSQLCRSLILRRIILKTTRITSWEHIKMLFFRNLIKKSVWFSDRSCLETPRSQTSSKTSKRSIMICLWNSKESSWETSGFNGSSAVTSMKSKLWEFAKRLKIVLSIRKLLKMILCFLIRWSRCQTNRSMTLPRKTKSLTEILPALIQTPVSRSISKRDRKLTKHLHSSESYLAAWKSPVSILLGPMNSSVTLFNLVLLPILRFLVAPFWFNQANTAQNTLSLGSTLFCKPWKKMTVKCSWKRKSKTSKELRFKISCRYRWAWDKSIILTGAVFKTTILNLIPKRGWLRPWKQWLRKW